MTSFVGALNVGSIKLNFDPKLTTNTSTTPDQYDYDLSYNRTYEKMKEPLHDYIKNN